MKHIQTIVILLSVVASSSCYGLHVTTFTLRPDAASGNLASPPSIETVAQLVQPVASQLGFERARWPDAHGQMFEEDRHIDIRIEERDGAIVVVLAEGKSGMHWWSGEKYLAARAQLGEVLQGRFGKASVAVES